MGKQFLLALGLIASGNAAHAVHAGYYCTAYDQSSTLKFSEHTVYSISGYLAEAIVTNSEGSMTFENEQPPKQPSASADSSNQDDPPELMGSKQHMLMISKQYELFQVGTGKKAELNIVGKPQMCGRAGCFPTTPKEYSASFDFEGVSTIYECKSLN